MKSKIFLSVMVAAVAWTVCGTGEALADLGDLPSTEEYVAMGVAAAAVITVIIMLAVNTDKAKDTEAPEGPEEQPLASGIMPPDRSPLHIDPVLTLQQNAVAAGLALSF